MSFWGKRIVITCGSGGLGRPIVRKLLDEGAEVAILSRNPAAERISGIQHLAVDLATLDGIANAASFVERERPDILINMAGTQYFGPIDEQSLDAMHANYMVNLIAPAALSRASVAFMKKRNSGQIAFVGSILGSIPLAHFTSYSSAKGGLRTFSEALRRELAARNIAITYIAPRAMRTGMLSSDMQKCAELTGMRVDAPEQVAQKVLSAIQYRRREVYIGVPEQLLVRLNLVLPQLVDAAVAPVDRKVAAFFIDKGRTNRRKELRHA
jgi:short-subunit dehydrogenase